MGISVCVEPNSSNLGKIKFGYSLQNDALTFDEYLTSEQDIGVKSCLYVHPLKLQAIKVSANPDVKLIILRVVTGIDLI